MLLLKYLKIYASVLKGREIRVYDSFFIESLIRAYEVFEGFDLRFNYPIGPYKVDFFVGKLMLVLECNGYCHRYYDATQEKEREKRIIQGYSLVRFHHKISLETLFNGILQAKPGTVIQLYDLVKLGQEMPFNINPLNAHSV